MSADGRVTPALDGGVGTSSADVRAEFVVTRAAEREYERWKSRPDRVRVVPDVEKHVTSALYRVSPEEIREVCSGTYHALGEVKKNKVIGIREVEDWNPDFAFTHLFHFLLEELGRVPTWDDFCDFHLRTDRGWWLLGNQLKVCCRSIARKRSLPDTLVWDALHWRVGNAYYGILRDVYAVVGLRTRGVHVRSHPMADALFRVDAWVGRTVLSLRVGNSRYRSGWRGRKKPAERLLRGADPAFGFQSIELPAATRFGEVHLPTERDLDAVARVLAKQHGVLSS